MVAGVALEEVAPEMTVGLNMADHRFDGGSPPQLTLDPADDAAPLPGAEHPQRLCLVAAKTRNPICRVAEDNDRETGDIGNLLSTKTGSGSTTWPLITGTKTGARTRPWGVQR